MRNVLVIASGGGHFRETALLMNSLYKQLNDRFIFHFIASSSSQVKALRKVYKGSVIDLVPPLIPHRKVNYLFLGLRFLRSLFHAKKIILKVNPDAVLWVGAAMGIPYAVWAKLSGKKVIFIESITRVHNLSLTGKLVKLFHLTDYIYVQWPDLEKKKLGIYKGWVL